MLFTPTTTYSRLEPEPRRGTEASPSGPPDSASTPPPVFIRVTDPESLLRYRAELEALAEAAAETNVFYEPWMLFPALDGYGRGKNLSFVMAFADESSSDGPVLCGFFPLELRSRYHGIPLPTWTLWRYPHSFLATPLLRQGCEATVLEGFFEWLKAEPRGAVLLELGHVSGSGPFHSALQHALLRHPDLAHSESRFERALFVRGASADRYLDKALSKKRRKEYRRLERRLADHGEVSWDELRSDGDAARWVDEFLELEASGWKGRAGTAFASRSLDREYFRSVAHAAFARGRLRMLALRLDGRAVAIKCNLVGRGGGFAFKIAYDESFHRYSPGVLLELEQIRSLHETFEVDWLDSCAASDHFMANRLWTDRRPMRTLVTSTGHVLGNAIIAVVDLLKRAFSKGLRGRLVDVVEKPEAAAGCPSSVGSAGNA